VSYQQPNPNQPLGGSSPEGPPSTQPPAAQGPPIPMHRDRAPQPWGSAPQSPLTAPPGGVAQPPLPAEPPVAQPWRGPQSQDRAIAAPRPELQGTEPAVPQDPLAGGIGEPILDEHDLGLTPGPGKLKASLSRTNLILLAAFLLGVGLVAFMSLRKGPSETSAAQEQSEQQADSAIDRFLVTQQAAQRAGRAGAPTAKANGQIGGKKRRGLIGGTRSLVQMFTSFTSKNQVPLDELKTNPFRFAARPPTHSQQTAEQQKAAELARFAEEARRQRVEQLKAEFPKLRLQSVVTGPAGKRAMINSTVVGVGDTVGPFTVAKIEPRRVILTAEGETFILEINF